MEDRETARKRKYGECKTTRIMMATVPQVISGLGLRKFQADGFLLTRVYVNWNTNLFFAFPWRQWLRERFSMTRWTYTCVAYLVSFILTGNLMVSCPFVSYLVVMFQTNKRIDLIHDMSAHAVKISLGFLFFFHAATAPSGPRPSHCRGITITLRHTTIVRTLLDQWPVRRRDLWL